jgi:aryl-alcohol dehydrogenase-like predicted oxidoreductase
MQLPQLGTSGPKVSAIGLGCMEMSDGCGPADRAESIATIHAALDAGITLLDTGDFYGMGHNELLLAKRSSDATAMGQSSASNLEPCKILGAPGSATIVGRRR